MVCPLTFRFISLSSKAVFMLLTHIPNLLSKSLGQFMLSIIILFYVIKKLWVKYGLFLVYFSFINETLDSFEQFFFVFILVVFPHL